jgi:nucleotide-binding universal stress UspA family protein
MKDRVNKILVPVEYNEPSYNAAALGLALARGLDASLTLIHIHMRELATRETVEINASDLDAVSEPAFRGLLDKLVGDATKSSLESFVDHSVAELERVPNSPADVIVEYAGSHGIDLIVIGSRHQSRLHDLIMGDVTKDVLERAPCPVTVLH